MLRIAAFALVALLVAGCAVGDDTTTPPNADPNGPVETVPPTPSSNTTGPPTTAPTTSSSSSSSASPAPGVTLSGAHQEDSGTHAQFPGLIVAGQLDVSGNVARLEANANNIGQRTYRVSNICVTPWGESMTGPSGDAQHREPKAVCTAFGLRDFPPGESLPFSSTWNGTLWTGSGYGPAPDGTYTWTAKVTVYSGGSGSDFDNTATITLEFNVTAS
jgi:hypothetical protein